MELHEDVLAQRPQLLTSKTKRNAAKLLLKHANACPRMKIVAPRKTGTWNILKLGVLCLFMKRPIAMRKSRALTQSLFSPALFRQVSPTSLVQTMSTLNAFRRSQVAFLRMVLAKKVIEPSERRTECCQDKMQKAPPITVTLQQHRHPPEHSAPQQHWSCQFESCISVRRFCELELGTDGSW